MTVREYRDARDRRRKINRREVYGSDNAYFPLPKRVNLQTETSSSKIATPTGKVVRNKPDYSTRNYDNKQNMIALGKLFA